jgi:hypothetical protein
MHVIEHAALSARMNETRSFPSKAFNNGLNEESPAFSAGLFIGRTTEGTLGRCSSTVANRARGSDGGGVLINFIKLAAVL